ncbi:MAG: hypothetical protein U1E59_08835 [Amaricoccus sp.]
MEVWNVARDGRLGLVDALVSGKVGARPERIAGAIDSAALGALPVDLRSAQDRSYGWLRVRYRGPARNAAPSTCSARPSTCGGSTA